jgi:acyl-CoA synthetase (NDP forming)
MLRGYIDHGRFLRESGSKPSEKTSASGTRAKAEAILKAYPDISMLPHSATVELLKQYGFQCAEYRLATNYEEAKNAAERLGFPVILKGMVANVAHRSDAGLLSRKISTEAELQQEFAALEVKARQTTNGSAVISVEKYFPHDFEVILGVKYDATFGPVILCGLGGVFTEILKDYVLRLAPLTTHAADVIDRVRKLLENRLTPSHKKLISAVLTLNVQRLREEEFF